VANDDKVEVGEHVVTSGMDRIFPRDLPVGTVKEIKPGNPFKLIRVLPAASLERLEEVIVLLTLQPLDLQKGASETATPVANGKVASGVAAADKPAIDKPALNR
jgi:rod shape-determining protein MreC